MFLSTEIGDAGQILFIHNVTRLCAGRYECVADNGVSPSVSREIAVNVKCKTPESLKHYL